MQLPPDTRSASVIDFSGNLSASNTHCDCDDMQMKFKSSSSDYNDDSDNEHSPTHHGGGGLDRKRRRGVIEKRRRDRINLSLSELKRLVPSAFEKQGSAKLEKAEILQMTVDYLRSMQQKGYYGDPATLAMDYRSIGYRECVAEVSRYLVTAEGMDLQDPLRIRLLSHLQYYGTQKEACVRNTSWSSSGNQPSSGQYPVPTVPAGNAPFSAFEHRFDSGKLAEPVSAFTAPTAYNSYSSTFGQLLPHSAGQYGHPTTPQKPYRPWGTELGTFS